MSNISIFDILGPVMIGPSSSHTAGAERLGHAARCMAGNDFDAVEFHLHGSFAMTYKGHGTDKALTAGILGMKPDDERLKDSLSIAAEKGINIEFIEADLGDVHPNTVKIILKKENKILIELTGSSIGGGNIVLNSVGSDKLDVSGDLPVCIVKHKDIRGMISKITSVMAINDINIANLKVSRERKGEIAITVIETDNPLSEDAIAEISAIRNVISVKTLNILKD